MVTHIYIYIYIRDVTLWLLCYLIRAFAFGIANAILLENFDINAPNTPRLLKATSHSSVHWKACFSVLKKWRHLSVALETNLFMVATCPISLCTSFTFLDEVMSIMALTFFGLASIPRWDTTNLRNLPDETPNHDIHQCNDHDPCESDNTSSGLVS